MALVDVGGGRALFEPNSMGAEGWWSVDDNLTTALTSSGFERRTETTKAVTRKDDGPAFACAAQRTAKAVFKDT